MDLYPILSNPVKRPDVFDPSTCVDVMHGTHDNLVSLAIALVHGANYNDPAPFESRQYQQVTSSACMPWSF